MMVRFPAQTEVKKEIHWLTDLITTGLQGAKESVHHSTLFFSALGLVPGIGNLTTAAPG